MTWIDRVFLILALCVFVSIMGSLKPQSPAPFLVPASVATADQAPVYSTFFVSSDVDDFTHAPAVAPTPEGGLVAVWFAGTREGAADVNIRTAHFDPVLQAWTSERNLISRPTSQAALGRYIRKLGNPVIALAPNGRLWLFYVSVSVGGWAGSAINTMHSDDGGLTWSTPRRLITSPAFNLSTLVRNAPVFHQDGTIGLPVYHEFLGKFPEYLHLDSEGQVINKYRMARGRYSLQPTVVPLSDDSAVAYLRNADKPPFHVLSSRTHDRGQNWSRPRSVDVLNPNSSLAAINDVLSDTALVVLNDIEDKRFRLSLYRAPLDGSTWRRLAVLDASPDPEGDAFPEKPYTALLSKKFLAVGLTPDTGKLQNYLQEIDERVCNRVFGCEFEYEYPYAIRTADGYFHVLYAWNNSFIKHVMFNSAWVEAQQ